MIGTPPASFTIMNRTDSLSSTLLITAPEELIDPEIKKLRRNFWQETANTHKSEQRNATHRFSHLMVELYRNFATLQ
jgi:hypothetical protein